METNPRTILLFNAFMGLNGKVHVMACSTPAGIWSDIQSCSDADDLLEEDLEHELHQPLQRNRRD